MMAYPASSKDVRVRGAPGWLIPAAAGLFFLGRRIDEPITDLDVLAAYKGAV